MTLIHETCEMWRCRQLATRIVWAAREEARKIVRVGICDTHFQIARQYVNNAALLWGLTIVRVEPASQDIEWMNARQQIHLVDYDPRP